MNTFGTESDRLGFGSSTWTDLGKAAKEQLLNSSKDRKTRGRSATSAHHLIVSADLGIVRPFVDFLINNAHSTCPLKAPPPKKVPFAWVEAP